MEEKLTLELLAMIKANVRKWFIIAIIFAVMFFVSNLYWIYNSYLPAEKTETYDIVSEEEGNAVYNDSGKVKINGESNSKKNDN